VGGDCPLIGPEKFAAAFAEVTDALALEVSAQLRFKVGALEFFLGLLHRAQGRNITDVRWCSRL
jgi:hypothetical protein